MKISRSPTSIFFYLFFCFVFVYKLWARRRKNLGSSSSGREAGEMLAWEKASGGVFRTLREVWSCFLLWEKAVFMSCWVMAQVGRSGQSDV